MIIIIVEAEGAAHHRRWRLQKARVVAMLCVNEQLALLERDAKID